MATYTKIGKLMINGKKKIIYKKDGSTKQYIVYKSKHVGLVKYKKMMAKKMMKKMKGGSTSMADMINNMKSSIQSQSSAVKTGGKKNKRSKRKVSKNQKGGEGMLNDMSGSLLGASNGMSNSFMEMSGSLSGMSNAVSGSSSVKKQEGGKCRKVKRCKKVKSGKNKGKKVCRKVCK